MPDPIQIAIPAMGERAFLPRTLTALAEQSDLDFEVWVCVNQSRQSLGSDPDLTANNRATISELDSARYPFPLHLIDAARGDQAPDHAVAGVGWARRTLADRILHRRPKPPLVICLDADTRVPADYVAQVRDAFRTYPNALGLAAPYRHPVPPDPDQARAILLYEIYMRYYQINLWRIGSPYAYLPLGSALAFTPRGYQLARGFPVRKAAEDFYFLQNLRKNGPLIRYLDAVVEPSPRASDRVPFGTGATIGASPCKRDSSIQFWSLKSFDQLALTYRAFDALFADDVDLPLGAFSGRVGDAASFRRMRANSKRKSHFLRACHQRLDALRTLQFVRWDAQHRPPPAMVDALRDLGHVLDRHIPPCQRQAPLDQLAELRARLFEIESQFQRAFMSAWDLNASW